MSTYEIEGLQRAIYQLQDIVAAQGQVIKMLAGKLELTEAERDRVQQLHPYSSMNS